MLRAWSIVAFWLMWCAATSAQTVMFKTVERGGQSGIETTREVVVRTEAEWTALWKQHAPGRKRPPVDFTGSMVVGVFLGSRPTGGFDVEITRVERQGADLVVSYLERKPDPSDIVTQIITMPYHLVATERSDAPVRFARER